MKMFRKTLTFRETSHKILDIYVSDALQVVHMALSSGFGYTLFTQSRRLHVQLCDVISPQRKKALEFLRCVSESKKPSQSQKSSDGLVEPQLCDGLAPWCCPMPSPSGDMYLCTGFRQFFLPRVRVDTKWVHKLLVTEWSVSHETKKNTSSQRMWLACFQERQ